VEAGSPFRKCVRKKSGAYSDRKTGIHFCGIRDGLEVAKSGEADSGVAMFLRRPFRVVSELIYAGAVTPPA
jgi:hypothetical protein